MDKLELLQNLYNDLAKLKAEGNEAAAKKLLEEKFPQLPEDLQGELVTRMYLNAMVEQVEREDVIAEIQERGLEALDILDILKKQIESNPQQTE